MEENLDRIFRDKLKDNAKIPSNISWNKEIGWHHLEKMLPISHSIFNGKWFKVAASLVIVAISFWGGLKIQKHLSEKTIIASEADKALKEIDLPGGHHCTLAPYSKIQYMHSALSDTLYLEGEAFIESADKRKIVIKAKNAVITCLAAQLNLRANFNEKSTLISTVSGFVSAQCTDNNFPALTVAASEQYAIYEGGIMTFKSQNNDPNFLAWKTGVLTFDNMPMEYVVKVMEDYYGACIKIEKEELKYCRFTSQLKNVSLKEALQSIETSLNLRVKQKGLMYSLAGKGC